MESNSVEQHGAGNREVPRNRRGADDSRGVRSPASSSGLEVDRVEAFALEIVQRHREHSGIGVDATDAIELQTVERRAVLLQVTRDADEFGLRAKRQIHLVGPKGPGIDWAG